MIQNTIMQSLLQEINKEKSSNERFKLLEQLELFARSCAMLKSEGIYPSEYPAYEQLKVAVQDLLIDLGLKPADLITLIEGGGMTEREFGYPTVETAQKLIDAGIIDKPSNK